MGKVTGAAGKVTAAAGKVTAAAGKMSGAVGRVTAAAGKMTAAGKGTAAEHVDVLIIGAGLSGIGTAHHLQTALPGKRYLILEARQTLGGTWDLFRYPGIRSDSDMLTMGYRFRPWLHPKAIAEGATILTYLQETAAESGIDRHIRYGHRAVRASWSSEESRWTVDVVVDDGRTVAFTADFLVSCGGYYRYDEGFTPHFEGLERFSGPVFHAQHWPEGLDYTGKRVVVVGSGATAVTLVPALAESAAHVTMLQRSPSYVASRPAEDAITNRLRATLGNRAAYLLGRWKNVALGTFFFQLARRRPHVVKRLIRKGLERHLPPGYDIDTHFTPRYNPWDQRMCLVPDGDLFTAIREGRASIATDHIDHFTEDGIRLRSGQHLAADIAVLATGLNLRLFGGMELTVDGRPVDPPSTLVYRGMMLSAVPNFVFIIGYTNASWTLKADLVGEFLCRLLARMDSRGYSRCTPVNDDPSMPTLPLLDFTSGYVKRSLETMPKNGSRPPWRLGMSYAHDVVTLRYRKIEDGVLRFS
ncbi:MAG TPA: NAD(P)/FAD-dependent oxidoreductase [Candidatus Limnocylindrales bacterium]